MTPAILVSRRNVVIGIYLLMVLIALVLGAIGLKRALGCGPVEREIFAEIPHYEDRNPEPRSDFEMGVCLTGYVAANDSRQEIFAHYEKALRERGWEVHIRRPPEPPDSPPPDAGPNAIVEQEPPFLIATRDGRDYMVDVYEGGQAGDPALVNIIVFP